MAPKQECFGYLRSWQKPMLACQQIWLAASEVVWKRTIQMATGTMSAAETTRMVMEKPVALAQAARDAWFAAAFGKDGSMISVLAIKLVHRKVRSNAKRLRRRRH